MKRLLILGAGRSSVSLIEYLLKHAGEEDWEVTVADISQGEALKKTRGHHRSRVVELDILQEGSLQKVMQGMDLVISMLPAALHLSVARECIRMNIHLATASYVAKEMKMMEQDIQSRGLIFLNEMGLDPGIDHMSAMEVINRIRAQGGVLESFRSYCGGLVDPGSDTNPWGYKFSWNPRNVVLAGQGTACFREDGVTRFLPYQQLFREAQTITVAGAGDFDAYANRDSLSYIESYGIPEVKTLLRGTLRRSGFCKAWDAFVQLGLTDDSWQLPSSAFKNWDQLLNAFIPRGKGDLKHRTAKFLGIRRFDPVIKKLEWLGIFGKTPVRLASGSPARFLQDLLERKWKLGIRDKDQIVMHHEFLYRRSKKRYHLTSSLVLSGKDPVHTAMAATVGLPLAMGAKHILRGTWKLKGVIIPVLPEIYTPVLEELKEYGIRFEEKEKIQNAR